MKTQPPSTAIIAVLVLVMFLPCAARNASADSWEQAGGSPGHSSYVDWSLDPANFEQGWTVTHAFPQKIGTSWGERAVACDGRNVFQTVRTGSEEMAFYDVCAFNLHDGTQSWRTSIQARTHEGVGEPSVLNGVIFVNRAGHSDLYEGTEFDLPRMYALDADNGSVLFTTAYEDQWGENDRATVIGNQVLAGGGFYGGMYSFSGSAGGAQWHVDCPLSAHVAPRPAVHEDCVYAFRDHFYSRTDGSYLGRVEHPDDPEYLSNPIISDNGTLVYNYVDGGERRISAFDASSREHLWDSPISSANLLATAVGGGRVGVLTNQTNELIVLDEESGAELLRWTLGQELYPDLILTDTHAFVQSGAWVHAVNLESGRSDWSGWATGDMALSNGYLLLSGEERLVAFRLIPEPATASMIFALGIAFVFRRGRRHA